MLRKATVWKVSLADRDEPMYVMTPGSSFYDIGDLAGLLKSAASEFKIDKDSQITGIEKHCIALGTTKLPYEGALELREDGSIAVNDPERAAVLAGLSPQLAPFFEGTVETLRKQDAHDEVKRKTGSTPEEIVEAVNRAPSILEAVDRAERRRRNKK